jgi:hypothetical protein
LSPARRSAAVMAKRQASARQTVILKGAVPMV